jgi:hypothetical protein
VQTLFRIVSLLTFANNADFKPVVLNYHSKEPQTFGSEAWVLKKREEQRLEAA